MDDVTIEDEFESNEEIPSKSQIKPNLISMKIFQILSQQWILLLFLIICIAIFIYRKTNRRRNSSSTVDFNDTEDDLVNRYDHMQRIRQEQQKAYEEQALRYAEQKKAKMEPLKSSVDEKSNRLKYRSDDYNPLTGQSNRDQGDSCSWRPSSRRKPAGG